VAAFGLAERVRGGTVMIRILLGDDKRSCGGNRMILDASPRWRSWAKRRRARGCRPGSVARPDVVMMRHPHAGRVYGTLSGAAHLARRPVKRDEDPHA